MAEQIENQSECMDENFYTIPSWFKPWHEFIRQKEFTLVQYDLDNFKQSIHPEINEANTDLGDSLRYLSLVEKMNKNK